MGLVDGRFQWVVFTSTNAVRAVWEKFNELRSGRPRVLGRMKIACVGQGPRPTGCGPSGSTPSWCRLVSNRLSACLMSSALRRRFDPVNRVLMPRADIATETLAEGLRERGWEIEDVTAYRTVRSGAAACAHARDDQDRLASTRVLHLQLDGAQPGRHRGQAARQDHRRVHWPENTLKPLASSVYASTCKPEVAAVGPLVEALAEHAAGLRAEGALPPPRKKSRRR